MSTSLLYHAFGTSHFKYLKTEYIGGQIIFFIEKKEDKQRCIKCGSRRVSSRGGRNYKIRTLPIGNKPVILNVRLDKLHCKDCGCCLQEKREIADPRKSYTRQFARLVIDLAEIMTLLDIAKFLNVKWHLVRDIIKDNLERREKQRSWHEVRRIAIDEIAVRKGHRYMTVVVDLESGIVLDAVEGRKAEALEPVFKRLKRAGAKLEAVAMDMCPAFRKAVETYWPKKVAIVHDPFHIVQAMNRVVDDVRRTEQARLEAEDLKVVKGNRFLLLRGWENLEKDERADEKINRLEAMLNLNQNLYRVYLLKEDLRLLWRQTDKNQAEQFLDIWLEEARSLGIATVTRMATTLSKHRTEILSWYDYPITTGPLEGLNNKIKVLKRRAYGYRNRGFFRLLILFIHKSQFQLSRS